MTKIFSHFSPYIRGVAFFYVRGRSPLFGWGRLFSRPPPQNWYLEYDKILHRLHEELENKIKAHPTLLAAHA